MLLSHRSLAMSRQQRRSMVQRVESTPHPHTLGPLTSTVPRRSQTCTLSWNNEFEENSLPGAPSLVFGPGIDSSEAQDFFPGRVRETNTPRPPSQSKPSRPTEATLTQVFPGVEKVETASITGRVNSSVSESRSESSSLMPLRQPKDESTNKGLFEFTDRDVIKQRVRRQMLRGPTRKVDHYAKSGFFSRIARHPLFDHMTLAVIALNALWTWIDTDLNKADTLSEADPFFQIVEHLFCSYFTLEIVVRFLAFDRKRNVLRDPWFIFDTLLVVLMVAETWVLLLASVATGGPVTLGGDTSVLRLVRLLRLSRLMRFMRSMSELMILVKGMITAMKSVLYVTGLLAILTYVFAIALTQLSKDMDFHEEFFDSVALSMYSLLLHGTMLDELAGFCNAIRAESSICLILFLIYIALANCTVMNMLIGVLCEVVSSTAVTEREEIMTNTVSEKMLGFMTSADGNHDNKISFKEFGVIMNTEEAKETLREIGVDLVHIEDFAELFFFEDGREVERNFEDFMSMILDLRGSNHATVKDIKQLWLDVKTEFNMQFDETKALRKDVEVLDMRQRRLEDKLESVLREVREISKAVVKPLPGHIR